MNTIRNKKRYILSSRHTVFTPTFIMLLSCILILVVLAGSVFFVRRTRSFLPSLSEIYTDWNKSDYQSVYEKTGLILNKHPLDGKVLALNGFSAFYLFSAQTDTSVAGDYLSQAVSSLRNAWYRVSDSERPMIAYVLGKSYYHCGSYYSDLAVKYLDYANEHGARFPDLAEFRGLSESLLGNYDAAISAFTDALAINKSDLLLFSLAENYQKSGNVDMAKQYFGEVIRTSTDEILQLKSSSMLGMLFLEDKDYTAAEREFTTILEKDVNFADAHYGLGVIYEAQGDLVKARAEWRRVLRIDPVHSGARDKLKI